jgi:hypothetical protein
VDGGEADPASYVRTILAAMSVRQRWREQCRVAVDSGCGYCFKQLAHRIQRSSIGMLQHGPKSRCRWRSRAMRSELLALPLDLLQNFPQINAVECAGTILRATQLDEAALWGLIDALRDAGAELVEVQPEPIPPPIARDAGP